jgi:hypothetical protein
MLLTTLLDLQPATTDARTELPGRFGSVAMRRERQAPRQHVAVA